MQAHTIMYGKTNFPLHITDAYCQSLFAENVYTEQV